jgi:hypothetical protein
MQNFACVAADSQTMQQLLSAGKVELHQKRLL